MQNAVEMLKDFLNFKTNTNDEGMVPANLRKIMQILHEEASNNYSNHQYQR